MAKPTHKSEGVIYFLLAREVNRIKIGFTQNLKQRFRDLLNNSPCELEILKVVHGTLQTELAVHAVFNQYRLAGEWYKNNPKLTSFIHSLEDGGRLQSEDIAMK